MAIELINPRFNDYDEIEVEFRDSTSDIAGNLVVELDPREDGRFGVDINLHSPLPGHIKIISEERQRHLAGLEDKSQLTRWVDLVIRDAFHKHESTKNLE